MKYSHFFILNFLSLIFLFYKFKLLDLFFSLISKLAKSKVCLYLHFKLLVLLLF